MAPVSKPARDERRLVTVLFADISGFTALSEQIDPEDVKAFADRCTQLISQQVRHFGGTVLRIMGDEVLAVFGVPVAHEDNAERAVRAGLAVRTLNLDDDKQVRIHAGINTGEVMAGFIGPQDLRDYSVMGDVVNTAARLRSAAAGATVLVGEATYRATRHSVRYREVPPIAAKGKDKPVPVWEALEATQQPLARALGRAPLIGRDEELGRLEAAWRRVLSEARPHLVTLLGEPGIGKSRLTAEFESRTLMPNQALVLHGRCLPYGEALGYGAFAGQLREAAGITAEDRADAARARLARLVRQVLTRDASLTDQSIDQAAVEVARHLALLSGLDLAPDRETGAVDQRALHATARRFLEALARRQPVCLIFEDLHWADDALLDLVEHVAARAREAPLLVLAQARSTLLETHPAWGRAVPAFTSLPLAPLSEAVERRLIEVLAVENGLSPDVAAEIGRGAGGNPLFAEEIVHMMAEGGGMQGVPSMIKLLISARLDVLAPDARGVILLASVFGRVFWEQGLVAIGAPVGSLLTEHLEVLEQKDLIRAARRSQFRGEREYTFKHDLIRDVAYDILPRAERRILHGQVADWVEQVAGDQVDGVLDQLAYHAVAADQRQRAVTYLQRAAKRAASAAAHRRAAALLTQAIELAQALDNPALLAELHTDRGTAFLAVGLWTDARPELEAALQRLPPQAAERRAEVLLQLAVAQFWLSDMPSMLRHSREALAVAQAAGRDDLAATALANLASGQVSDGDLAGGISLYERALQSSVGRVQGHSPAWSIFGTTYYWMGHPAEALPRTRAALEAAQGDTSGMLFCLGNLGLALMGLGEYGEAERIFQQAEQFGREYEVWPFLARSMAMSAGWRLDVHDFEGNLTKAEEARELARSVKFMPAVVSASIDLLFNYARRGLVAPAEALVDEVSDSVRNASGSHGWLWRLRFAEALAEIALAREDWALAAERAEAAIAQARAHNRPKYLVLGLRTHAQALQALGRTPAAVADLREAVTLARPTGDPAMLVHAASALLAIEPEIAVAIEAKTVAERILSALPDDATRQRVAAADPFRKLLTRHPTI